MSTMKINKVLFTFVAIFIVAKLNVVLGKNDLSSLSKKTGKETFLQPQNSSNNMSHFTKNSTINDFSKTSAALELICRRKPQFRLDQNFLLTFLLQLKLCQLAPNNSWFYEECANPLYDLTEYHKASYDKICNPAKYATFCQLTEIKQHLQPSAIIRRWLKQRNIVIQDSDDEKQNETFHNRSTAGNLTRLERMTCQSIESYFEVLSEQMLQNDFVNLSQNFSNVFQTVPYTEWYHKDRAFCKEAGCGVSTKNYKNFSITFGDCVSESCYFANVIAIAVDGLIALLIAVANILILTIFFQTSMMKNIPGYFKLNLAVSDLCVGLIIMPTVIYNRYRKTYLPLPYRYDDTHFGLSDYFDQKYLQVVGFLGLLFLFVSIFTLCAASVDRYLAITKPFEYETGKYFTKKKTVVILLILWLVCSAWAVIPIFAESTYTSFGSDLILPNHTKVTISYGFVLGVPLITAWIFNLALLINVRASNRKKANSRSKRSNLTHGYCNRSGTESGFSAKSNCIRDSKPENCMEDFGCENKFEKPSK